MWSRATSQTPLAQDCHHFTNWNFKHKARQNLLISFSTAVTTAKNVQASVCEVVGMCVWVWSDCSGVLCMKAGLDAQGICWPSWHLLSGCRPPDLRTTFIKHAFVFPTHAYWKDVQIVGVFSFCVSVCGFFYNAGMGQGYHFPFFPFNFTEKRKKYHLNILKVIWMLKALGSCK